MTIIGRYKYEIDSINTARIWDLENPNENDAPFFLQDIHPDGRAWNDKAEVQAWVDAFIAELTKPAEAPVTDAPTA